LPAFFVCEKLGSLTLREETMAESRVLRKMSGPEKEVTGNGEGNVMMSFMTELS